VRPWIVRPGRFLLLLEGVGVGLPIAFGAGFAIEAEPLGTMVVASLTLLAPLMIVTAALGEPPSIVDAARPARARALAPIVAFGLFGFGVLDWGPARIPLALVAGASALLAGAWSLWLAREASTWIAGRVDLRDEPALITDSVTYLLDRPPAGSAHGDPLTLPRVEVHAMQAGPFRSGRSAGFAPAVLPVARGALVRGLAVRGGVTLAWALLAIGQAIA